MFGIPDRDVKRTVVRKDFNLKSFLSEKYFTSANNDKSLSTF